MPEQGPGAGAGGGIGAVRGVAPSFYRVINADKRGLARNVESPWKDGYHIIPEDSMALDWSQCPEVESVPGKVSGAWVFRDTRLPVATIFENLEDGMTIEEVMEQFDVTREQINAVLEFAARSLDAPVRP
jgi:uncharacterized protein (DUF433 family)